MEKLIGELRAYGADIEDAMARLLNDETLYAECIRLLLEDSAFYKLETAMEHSLYEEAFNQAHTLKGVLGNLGLTPLYQSACSLVDALRAQEYPLAQERYQVFQAENSRMRGAIAAE